MTQTNYVTNIESQKRLDALKVLKDAGLTFSDCVTAFADSDENSFVIAAKELASLEEYLEVDSPTVVSPSKDGAYVQAWIWVNNAHAGIYTPSEALDKLLSYARRSLASEMDLQPDVMALRSAEAAWLEHFVLTEPSLFEGIETQVLPAGAIPAVVEWEAGDGQKVKFMPSDAISQLRLLARWSHMPDNLSEQVESFISKYGNKLDAILAHKAKQK